MLKKFGRRTFVIIVAVVAAVAVVGSTLAWFVTSSSLSQKFSISGFDVGADVYFADGDTRVNGDAYKDSDGLFVLSLNRSDVNYIGNLRVDVTHTGAKSRIRVRMSHEWSLDDGTVVPGMVSVPYKFGSEWYDNRETDYCVYYRGLDSTGKVDFNTNTFISGFDASGFNSDDLVGVSKVRVLIQVDGVQVNRYPQLWNIDTLPWK